MNAREYWTVLREDRWLVGAVVVVCVAIAAAVAVLLPRTYTSSAVFYVASPQTTTSSTDSYQGAQLSTERVKSYTELVTGPRVAADAAALLGGRPTADEIQNSVSADAVAETVVLTVGVTQPTPEEAQLVAQAVTTSFTRLVNSIESTGQPVNRPIVSTEVIYPPTLPVYPAGPGTTMLVAAGLLAGIVLGVGAALARRSLRRAVDTPELLGTGLGTTVLASVPALPRRPERPALLAEPAAGRRGRRAALARERAAAVRRLRTATWATAGTRRCLVVTGVRSGQGATTVAVDLAVALSAAGESVLLVDADLRRPSVASRLGLDPAPGLAAAVVGAAEPDRLVQRWAPGRLDVLASGPQVERPGEVWGTSDARSVVSALRSRYSWVLLDTADAPGHPETADLAALTDGALVVARRGSARPEDLDATASAFAVVGVPVIGAVLTFAADVPSTPAEAQRALPPGRSADVAAEPESVATESVATEPATEPAAEPVATEPAVAPVAEPTVAEPTVAEPTVAEPTPETPAAPKAPAKPRRTRATAATAGTGEAATAKPRAARTSKTAAAATDDTAEPVAGTASTNGTRKPRAASSASTAKTTRTRTTKAAATEESDAPTTSTPKKRASRAKAVPAAEDATPESTETATPADPTTPEATAEPAPAPEVAEPAVPAAEQSESEPEVRTETNGSRPTTGPTSRSRSPRRASRSTPVRPESAPPATASPVRPARNGLSPTSGS
ncbi:cellulose synthase operon protein YhjQ/BcsQ [Actinomycetospora sp. OC33-EN08]|uniref:Cellulose synthase operon protein YhjQ/BcsQ n=1 Tax=Actinomycetospora aurantiaca TaxID=3129233 RepID=A0ABU8MGS8_9PSEU